MLKLEKQFFDRIVDLLITHIGSTVTERQGWLAPTFSSHSAFYQRIDWTGNTRDFTVNLITLCTTYGTIEGEEALVLLIKALHPDVGQEQQAIIANLLLQLDEISTLPDVQPYRSLEVFELEHAEFFFGRRAMVDTLIATFRKTNFIALVGPSGSGKSSLVRAGLLTALRNHELPNSEGWLVKIFRPDENPLFSFYLSLIDFIEPRITELERVKQANAWADDLAAGHIKITETFKTIRQQQPKLPHLLLIADQFEETFTLSPDDTRRELFLDTLLAAAGYEWISVLLTLRADFFGHVLEYEHFSRQVDNGLVNLIPMTLDERRAAIEEPALRTGRRFEDGLVERILDDLRNEPGALPLLEFALTELWKRQTTEGIMTHAAYKQIGQVAGAITQHADAVFSSYKADQQRTIGAIFTRLVRVARPDEGTQDIKQRVNLANFDPSAQSLIQKLSDVRLLVTSYDKATKQDTVEIAHEALIRKWPRLQDWLAQRRDRLVLQRNLRELTSNWIEDGYHNGALLRGRQLRKFARLEAAELSPDERMYLRRSQRRYRLQLYSNLLMLLLVVALGGAWLSKAIRQANSAWTRVKNSPDDPIQSITMIPNTASIGLCIGTVNEGVACNRDGREKGWTTYENGLTLGESSLLLDTIGRIFGNDRSDLTRAADFVKIDPVNPDRIYIFQRTNEIFMMNFSEPHQAWRSLAANIPDAQCASHLIVNKEFEVYDGLIVAACYDGYNKSYLFIGMANEANWRWMTYTSPTLPFLYIHSIYLHSQDGMVYIGTEEGVYRAKMTTLTPWEKIVALPNVRLIKPNPKADSHLILVTFDRNRGEGNLYNWTLNAPVPDPLGASLRDAPIALAIAPTTMQEWMIYILLEDGTVLATKENGNQYTIPPYPSDFFTDPASDLLAVTSPDDDTTQLLLAHGDGLFALHVDQLLP